VLRLFGLVFFVYFCVAEIDNTVSINRASFNTTTHYWHPATKTCNQWLRFLPSPSWHSIFVQTYTLTVMSVRLPMVDTCFGMTSL